MSRDHIDTHLRDRQKKKHENDGDPDEAGEEEQKKDHCSGRDKSPELRPEVEGGSNQRTGKAQIDTRFMLG